MMAAHIEVDIDCIGENEKDRSYSGNVEDIGLENCGVNLTTEGVVERGGYDETKATINCG
jgi:hypothetical protein